MNIDIIMPYKEVFSEKKASAVSLTIKNSWEFSKFKSSIKVFGQFTEVPFEDINFVGLKINKLLHFGNNRSILMSYLNFHEKDTSLRKIIEFHNRPYLFNLAIRIVRNTPISLHFHNDPTEMRGSKTNFERMQIAKNADAVYFVSEFIKKRFLDGLGMNFNNLHVLPNGLERKLRKQPKKNKEIAFIGRLVQEKGAHIFIRSIRSLVTKYPEWKFRIIGTSKAGNEKLKTSYEKKIIKDFVALGHNTEYLGFVSNTEVKEMMKTLSILVVPSIWREPFGLTALEGFCYGAAVIASKVGGLEEMLDGTGLLIEDIDEIKLEKSITSLIQNKKLLEDYQNRSWINYKYNQSQIVKKQDRIRNEIFNSFYLS